MRNTIPLIIHHKKLFGSKPTRRVWSGSLILWAYFSAGGPGHLVHIHSIKYQQYPLLEILTMIQKPTSKSTQKPVTEHKMKLLPRLCQSSDLTPIENEWSELKRRSCESEGSGEILCEGMVSDLLSSVLQTHQAS
uniref:Uncharacterized protein n=1 Tax=Sinocyclocheilus grahami TaxID=75366 RepID=A0A672QS40_SINGR